MDGCVETLLFGLTMNLAGVGKKDGLCTYDRGVFAVVLKKHFAHVNLII